jgi:hypothetical protein
MKCNGPLGIMPRLHLTSPYKYSTLVVTLFLLRRYAIPVIQKILQEKKVCIFYDPGVHWYY